ncbi:PD-(D/E)XK nuclease-like domain-containing protein [Rhizobiales bacterium 3FA27D7]|jgi:hypothetical protein|uniref:PD-(D/E)XK nuclease-like domain-containing protein n=1 Tax=Mesorhizobium sp. 2RAF21 TaxID=3232995 RepID=UPI0010F71B71
MNMQAIGVSAHLAVAEVAPLIADGIHFGLAEAFYHADSALGSTGLKDLIDNAPDYWWSSWMNPAREPEKETPAKVFGRAVHKCVLEGRDAFEAAYAPSPEPDDYPEHLRTMDDLRAFLADTGMSKSGTKDELILRVKGVSGCPPIYEDVVSAFEKSKKLPLKRDEFNRILAASAFIRANSYLRDAFTGGQAEVSVFWTADGIRYKARFDYLKMRAIADLKSIRNPLNKSFVQACRERIASLDYVISAAHYMDARRRMAGFVKAGLVYGAPDTEQFRSWLIQVSGITEFAFVFVFWQAEGAPISHGFKISPGNPLLDSAKHSIAKAVWNYQRFMEEFGTSAAWVPSTPLDELDETDLPVWWQQKQLKG